MTLLPRTLLWRTFLLLALLMVLSVWAWFRIYAFYEHEPRARAAAQIVASAVNLTRAALINAAPEKRLPLLLDISVQEGIKLYPAEDDEVLKPLPNLGMFPYLAPELRARLGDQTRIAIERNGLPGLWVSFYIDEDEYWVRLPRDRFDRVVPAEWLGWAAATLLLSLLGAYFVVLSIARPLKGLAEAARAIGRGERPAPLPEVGLVELVTVAHAFNQMSHDLAQLDADRALILAGVSHDLRTPLARLRLGMEMMAGDEAMREGLVQDVEDMDRIIGQFLDFARETSGEAMGETDLAALVLDVAESYIRRGAPLDSDVPEDPPLPPMQLRPMALRRALSNLVENALRYAGSGTITLHLSRSGAQVFLEVLDEGPGIPPEETERIKRPFARLESARSNAAGAGLGLAIVDRVARAHGGVLQLLPRPEVDGRQGLAARIVLPFSPPTAPPRNTGPES
ncbi:MAG: ATP-binding protein [Rhodocyclaceae bacterium]|nr:ATP-binding protein [Rhodocyclaceae bacterium]